MSKKVSNQEKRTKQASTGVGSDAQGILCQQGFDPANPEHKEAVINTLKKYYFRPRKERLSYEHLAKEIGNISPMTIYRIIVGITKKPHPYNIQQIYHFLEKVRWIKIYEHEKKHGSWIHRAWRKAKVKFW